MAPLDSIVVHSEHRQENVCKGLCRSSVGHSVRYIHSDIERATYRVAVDLCMYLQVSNSSSSISGARTSVVHASG